MAPRSTYSARSTRPARAKARPILARLEPTFMITAASQARSRFTSASSSSVPGKTLKTSSPWVIGAPARAQQPLMPVTPGITSIGWRPVSRS